eukprot:SM000018S03692  [mRNA]  locus=s18:873862:880015:+ [translate_table: standard]
MEVVATVRAKLKPTPKAPGIDGVLMMAADQFVWSPNNPAAAVKVELHHRAITTNMYSAEKTGKALAKISTKSKTDGYIFEFATFADRDQLRSLVTSYLAKHGAVAAPATATKDKATGVRQSAVNLSEEEIKRRHDLLMSDSKLRELHRELVMKGALTEPEFWATRKAMLDGEANQKTRQKTGYASAMLADLRPQTDGRTNTVQFNLTPEIIHQIFAEKPAVHKAFLECVPAKMSQKEFWTKYFKAEYFFRKRHSSAALEAAEDDDDVAMFVREDPQLAEEARRKIRKVDPTLDMAADDADDYLRAAGHGLPEEDRREKSGGARRSIFQDLNRHAAVVLDGRPLGVEVTDAEAAALALKESLEVRLRESDAQEAAVDDKHRKERVEEMTEMEDLQGPQPDSTVPLLIQDPRKYFDAQEAAAASQDTSASAARPGSIRGSASSTEASQVAELNLEEYGRELARQITGLQSRHSGRLISPAAATRVFNELNGKIRAAQQREGPNAEAAFLSGLPENIKSVLFQSAETVKELLKHFWAAYPLTSQLLADKVDRVKGAMDKIYDELTELSETTPSEHRHQVSHLFRPIFQALDAAFEHHKVEAEKRATRRQASHATTDGVRA